MSVLRVSATAANVSYMNAAVHRLTRLHARRRHAVTLIPAPRYPKTPRDGAGILLRHTDTDGTWVLLGRRTASLGGTWSNLGGSLDAGEAPLAGALRELGEEMLIPAAALIGGTIAHVVTTPKSDGGTYTMFVIDIPTAPRLPRRRDLPWEHTDVAWWFAADLLDGQIALHAGFTACWTHIAPRPLTLVEA